MGVGREGREGRREKGKEGIRTGRERGRQKELDASPGDPEPPGRRAPAAQGSLGISPEKPCTWVPGLVAKGRGEGIEGTEWKERKDGEGEREGREGVGRMGRKKWRGWKEQ